MTKKPKWASNNKRQQALSFDNKVATAERGLGFFIILLHVLRP
jgi:hypothetical protein